MNDEAATPPATPGQEEVVCDFHPWEPAVSTCANCNSLICEDCRVMVGRMSCCTTCHKVETATRGAREMFDPSLPYRSAGFPLATWPLWEPVLVFTVTFVLFALIKLLLLWLGGAGEDMATWEFVAQIGLEVAFFGFLVAAALYYVLKVHGATLAAVGLKWGHFTGDVGWGVLAGLLSFIFDIFFILFLRGMGWGLYGSVFERAANSSVSAWEVITLVLGAVILAPIAEEIFFRGYLYSSIRNRYGIQVSLLITASLFAVAHLDLSFMPRFVFGYLAGLAYEYRRNLAAPIVAHAVANGILVALTLASL
ncbi:MAG: CPBP family intramembrane metalloprotease [Actinobacteria bacterium]|nr:CPBP family intramembrane metalloprotease [Actinomycetota bacterium]MBU1943161.1 CPBP family intramembrane metalloprotease [Actinomycetota bacterium]MBU2687893.1 CPBP family intramembrane metalloprotease [Actinomycetota bacterium]